MVDTGITADGVYSKDKQPSERNSETMNNPSIWVVEFAVREERSREARELAKAETTANAPPAHLTRDKAYRSLWTTLASLAVRSFAAARKIAPLLPTVPSRNVRSTPTGG
jgi:hypothetical protein